MLRTINFEAEIKWEFFPGLHTAMQGMPFPMTS